jgi:hypothetical protein
MKRLMLRANPLSGGLLVGAAAAIAIAAAVTTTVTATVVATIHPHNKASFFGLMKRLMLMANNYIATG